MSSQQAVAVREVRIDDLPGLVGQTLGPSEPVVMTQARIDQFADATEDHQWLHVDPERAAAGPFGTTIAHGYLTLSMGSALLGGLLDVPDAARVVNIGLDRMRFTAPVPADAPLRLQATVAEVSDVKGGYQLRLDGSFLVDGSDRPACVATILFRYYRSTP